MMVLQTIAQTVLAVAVVVALVRLNGLRSFSKMASFDFALTIATGSVLATMMTGSQWPWQGMVALACLFFLRFAVSYLRQRLNWVQAITDNAPLILMHKGEWIEANMRQARVTRSELRSKLREADATDLGGVYAVVLEATGDVSVLTGDQVDAELLEDVSWGAATRPTRP